ncbi:Rha family transcriptional regulator [Psychrobacillus sp. NEAU-3TGS]|uniref:Rha family transcriptional regulator n=1 Tax=Psychrobacillus sp. NEAU-3TGS TaxID=2995412 RepID=UPI0024992A80|nr:Rha family transcriptional regulator [Psychrobacillus sp. NEAU-3TGS]MDI2588090.1 Rha family transcriptional regulator [Psychrobacillus sp. NEAU-3TGS]
MQVADSFNKQHKHVLEAIDELKGVAENSADLFYESSYQHPQNKQNYRMYLINRDGFTLLAMGFTGKEAIQFKLKYIEAFNKMEQSLYQPKVLSEKEQLRASMKLSLETSEEVEVLKVEVNDLKEKVENQITIDHGEQRRLQKAIGSRVYELESVAELRPKLFREIYREIKDRFGVASYKDVKRKDLQFAIRYVEAWIPKRAA